MGVALPAGTLSIYRSESMIDANGRMTAIDWVTDCALNGRSAKCTARPATEVRVTLTMRRPAPETSGHPPR